MHRAVPDEHERKQDAHADLELEGDHTHAATARPGVIPVSTATFPAKIRALPRVLEWVETHSRQLIHPEGVEISIKCGGRLLQRNGPLGIEE